MKSKVVLIDAFGQIFRSYFAFAGKPLLSPEGKNVNAVFGFFKSLFQLVRELKPTHLAICYDSRTPTFRHEFFPDYKAHRDAAPEDLLSQLPDIENLINALGLPILQKDGFEADDVIATAATQCRADGVDCWIVSNDKDLLQLVGGSVLALRSDGKGGYKTFGPEEVFADKGVRPDQILDWLALVGDTSDNIPGVPGIGEVSAKKLLAERGSLGAIYADLSRITSEAQRKKLEAGKDSAFLSRKLAELRTDVDCGFSYDRVRLEWKVGSLASELFLKLNAKSLAAEALSLGKGSRAPLEPAAEDGRAGEATIQRLSGNYETVTTASDLHRWVEKVRQAGQAAFDFETDSLDTMSARLAGLSVCCSEGEAAYIPFLAEPTEELPGPWLSESEVLEAFRALWEDPQFAVVGQNFKFDAKLLLRRGITLGRLHHDTMVAAWLLDAGATNYGLASLGVKYLGAEGLDFNEVVPKGKDFTAVEVPLATRYSCEDADLTWRLYKVFEPRLQERGLDHLMSGVEMPLTLILVQMEDAGILLQGRELDQYSHELAQRLADLEEEIFHLCGGKRFNLSSPKQLQEVLFVDRGLTPPPRSKIKTGWSTDSEVLEELSAEDPVPGKILAHRALAKLKSSYVDVLPTLVSAVTGRLHTQFLQTGTATGRLSSKDPNLQNIPIRDEDGRRIRRAFVPQPGWYFVSADYAQIELVVLAHLSKDPALTLAFREGQDIHRRTASLMFGVMEGLVTSEMRRAAKTINFGIMYGMSAFRLAGELKVPRKQAQEFWDAYQREFAGVGAYFQQVIKNAEQTGYVETLLGRRRVIPNISGRNRTEKQAAERIAMNTPIQGSAADIVKTAMLRVYRRLVAEKLEARILLQVHDELLLEVPGDEVEKVKEILRQEMESSVSLSVPLRVGIEVASNWGDMHA
ncbi:MAG: DNA polymerase I [Spirochaetales bacterium]|nr:DNA polymerase I [Spirochaetales bacterium]